MNQHAFPNPTELEAPSTKRTKGQAFFTLCIGLGAVKRCFLAGAKSVERAFFPAWIARRDVDGAKYAYVITYISLLLGRVLGLYIRYNIYKGVHYEWADHAKNRDFVEDGAGQGGDIAG